MYDRTEDWTYTTIPDGAAIALRANMSHRAVRTRRPHNPQGPFPVTLEFHQRQKTDGMHIYARLTPVNPPDLNDFLAHIDSLNNGITSNTETETELAARLDAEEDAELAALDEELSLHLSPQH